jgi:predicted nuclease of predicted toxin-antitoxin system
MKLLFDQNLSSALVVRLSDLFPESQHLKDLGMADAEDGRVWNHAAANGFTIVSKDSDFQQRSLLYGAPPKVVWLAVGNSPTALIERLIRDHAVEVHAFGADEAESLLVLTKIG